MLTPTYRIKDSYCKHVVRHQSACHKCLKAFENWTTVYVKVQEEQVNEKSQNILIFIQSIHA